jgi:hypothetical protein
MEVVGVLRSHEVVLWGDAGGRANELHLTEQAATLLSDHLS